MLDLARLITLEQGQKQIDHRLRKVSRFIIILTVSTCLLGIFSRGWAWFLSG